ncbi:MAG: dienelactone hydrolase family protein [Sporocytophaga sp.]|uniref:alpha/beta hydrolase n=1 Tax=Sporocytophaga sp. TaxID=2231183 RepID=UPI001B295156|nr:dienelactone hydrolase family protein [Sporocytophaga sp.]MBO9699574.1 dienelactone hydrolase family protein [Sporocytophaga sp.]
MHQNNNIVYRGKKLEEAGKVLIMLHGRGASAEDILSLSSYFKLNDDFAIIAPQATNHTWYPYSFLAEPSQNEPFLSSAIELLNGIVNDVVSKGIAKEKIYFLGFSQGACLTLEFVARYATRWGGAIAFTGGLIGDKLYAEKYKGDFAGTPIFIGTSDPDFHVPVQRVKDSTSLLTKINANVKEIVYKDMGHTIIQEEIDWANKWVLNNNQNV